jgi:anti-anti-sigma factor
MMERPYQQIEVEQHGPVTVVGIRHRRLEEPEVHALGNELSDLIQKPSSQWLVLDLGPGILECLYSVFLAKLVMVQRNVQDRHGELILCGAPPEVISVFEACMLKDYFEFATDRATAIAALNQRIPP